MQLKIQISISLSLSLTVSLVFSSYRSALLLPVAEREVTERGVLLRVSTCDRQVFTGPWWAALSTDCAGLSMEDTCSSS